MYIILEKDVEGNIFQIGQANCENDAKKKAEILTEGKDDVIISIAQVIRTICL